MKYNILLFRNIIRKTRILHLNCRNFSHDERVYNLQRLIDSYQCQGHLVANLDPLQTARQVPRQVPFSKSAVPTLLPIFYQFQSKDMDDIFYVPDEDLRTYLGVSEMRLHSIILHLQQIYCGTFALEYKHTLNHQKQTFLHQNFLSLKASPPPIDKVALLQLLVKGKTFEEFCGKKFSGAKRFSLEGCDSLLPGLVTLLQMCEDVEKVEMGMAHRGRLNVLRNVFQVGVGALFPEFQAYLPDELDSGFANYAPDVRYHLGVDKMVAFSEHEILDFRYKRKSKPVMVSLASNPSHLEAVNAVVLGKARCSQFLHTYDNKPDVLPEGLVGSKDYSPSIDGQRNVLPILLHGDASFFQGSVREVFGFSKLRDYTTGGTIHVVINNQIGFTTTPKEAHSSTHCTDVAKTGGSPVLHVNADDPIEVCGAFSLAYRYREQFLDDIVINLWGYRRHGHNEQDTPEVTQPIMYRAIKRHLPVAELFARKHNLVQQHEKFEKSDIMALTKSMQNLGHQKFHWLTKNDSINPTPTKEVSLQRLRTLARTMFTLPVDAFVFHDKVVDIYKERLAASTEVEDAERTIDWATAEALAIGTLVSDGHHVRLSGQDVERGTFGQRHAVIYDQEKEVDGEDVIYKPWTALQNDESGIWEICNSPLSEEGVLGFELGYSLVSKKVLVLWEAQFGDFANGAQTIIDTFLACGEEKWGNPNSLVILLPHGYEGQGPDHSSAKIERFLQLTNDHFPESVSEDIPSPEAQYENINFLVTHPSTPAQYFALLRDRAYSEKKKGLVMFTPKWLLHHKNCRSSLLQLVQDQFQPVILNQYPKSDILIFCSGKIYYNFIRKRLKANIIRLEMLSPFPFSQLIAKIKLLDQKPTKIIWIQEEPKNMGPFSFVEGRIKWCLTHTFGDEETDLVYLGRDASAAAATGSFRVHNRELQTILNKLKEYVDG
eukprot:maker-scaffold_7-snap-gene-19.74-mRNA-1 protein AED:0.03 eAED:0.03 QI:0/0/0/1/1/1/3/0/940